MLESQAYWGQFLITKLYENKGFNNNSGIKRKRLRNEISSCFLFTVLCSAYIVGRASWLKKLSAFYKIQLESTDVVLVYNLLR